MLIDKYARMPECRARELLSELPEVWQEHLCAIYDQADDSVILAMVVDGQEQPMLPADPKLRAIVDELDQILKQEYAGRCADDLQYAVDKMMGHIRRQSAGIDVKVEFIDLDALRRAFNFTRY